MHLAAGTAVHRPNAAGGCMEVPAGRRLVALGLPHVHVAIADQLVIVIWTSSQPTEAQRETF